MSYIYRQKLLNKLDIMKRWSLGLILILSASVLLSMRLQDGEGDGLHTFLHDKKTTGGEMSKDSILYFLDKPLFIQDSAGKFHPVLTFTFTYVERDIYIDPDGKPYIGTEVMGSSSVKSVVPEVWRTIVKERMKSGDTLVFNNPMSYYDLKDESTMFYAPAIKLIVK